MTETARQKVVFSVLEDLLEPKQRSVVHVWAAAQPLSGDELEQACLPSALSACLRRRRRLRALNHILELPLDSIANCVLALNAHDSNARRLHLDRCRAPGGRGKGPDGLMWQHNVHAAPAAHSLWYAASADQDDVLQVPLHLNRFDHLKLLRSLFAAFLCGHLCYAHSAAAVCTGADVITCAPCLQLGV